MDFFYNKFNSTNRNGSTQPGADPTWNATSGFKNCWGSSDKTESSPQAFDTRRYAEVRDWCLREGRLFEDPDFPAVDKTIYYSQRPPRPFVWKRPAEICSNPEFFVDGVSRFDVKQGELGDCWLLAAISCLCGNKDLLYRVVPPDQSFSKTQGYCGIFHFQFWRYGKWVDIIVDDRLPTYCERLVFMHSADNNEFWTPLLEKAYAKLFGSYEALKGGLASEAMEDFTGGVIEMYDFRQALPSSMFQIMFKAFKRGALMGCSIDADGNQLEAELSNGLIVGHAYSITSVKRLDIQTSLKKGSIEMVRVRNPWGNEREWRGAWSDKSPEWAYVSEQTRDEVTLAFDDDGEFWMSFHDFCGNFDKLEICNLGPDSVETGNKHWQATQLEGRWTPRVCAGGCRNYIETFWTNPQYRIEVTDPDDDDDDNTGTLLIALMQKNRRKKRKEGGELLTIGYAVYQLTDKDSVGGVLDKNFFKCNASVAKSPTYINQREVCGRHKLPPGIYCLVPSTFEPNKEGDFLVRIYSEKENKSMEIDEQTGISDKTAIKQRPNHNRKQKQTLGGTGRLPLDGLIRGPINPHSQLNLVDFLAQYSTSTSDTDSDQDQQQESQVRRAFQQAAGQDMEIDADELQNVLNGTFRKEFKFKGFSLETCRGMVSMMDVDRSGMLGYEEFNKLWSDISDWKDAFKEHDVDKNGTLNSYELRSVFHASGVTVSNSTFNTLVARYARKDGQIYFDDYIQCVTRLKTMFGIFKAQSGGKNTARFQLDKFIQTTMYS